MVLIKTLRSTQCVNIIAWKPHIAYIPAKIVGLNKIPRVDALPADAVRTPYYRDPDYIQNTLNPEL